MMAPACRPKLAPQDGGTLKLPGANKLPPAFAAPPAGPLPSASPPAPAHPLPSKEGALRRLGGSVMFPPLPGSEAPLAAAFFCQKQLTASDLRVTKATGCCVTRLHNLEGKHAIGFSRCRCRCRCRCLMYSNSRNLEHSTLNGALGVRLPRCCSKGLPALCRGGPGRGRVHPGAGRPRQAGQPLLLPLPALRHRQAHPLLPAPLPGGAPARAWPGPRRVPGRLQAPGRHLREWRQQPGWSRSR